MPAALPQTITETELHRIEAALLDALLDVRPDRTNAVDRLLSDPALSGPGRERVEELLLTAVLDTHPSRNRALDRILDEITATAPVV